VSPWQASRFVVTCPHNPKFCLGAVPLMQTNDNDTKEQVELSAKEASQARRGRPILYILVAGLAGAILALGAVYAYFA